MNRIAVVAVLAAALGAACSSGSKDDSRRPELRAAVDEAQYSLRQSIDLAVATSASGSPFEAAIVVAADPVFDVGVQEPAGLKQIRVNGVTGNVESNTPTSGQAPAPCPGSISLDEALAIAEAELGGEAIAVVPDDDVACAREIQVLVGEVLWEAKVAGDGAVLETELSDEYGGGEED